MCLSLCDFRFLRAAQADVHRIKIASTKCHSAAEGSTCGLPFACLQFNVLQLYRQDGSLIWNRKSTFCKENTVVGSFVCDGECHHIFDIVGSCWVNAWCYNVLQLQLLMSR